VVEQHTFKRKQRLYLSEQVNRESRQLMYLNLQHKASLTQSSLLQTDGSEPNKLVIMNADVVKVLMQTVS